MSCACTPILVGMASPVLEILLLSKTAKFPFLSMDYSPWSSKNSIDRNQLKKFREGGREGEREGGKGERKGEREKGRKKEVKGEIEGRR